VSDDVHAEGVGAAGDLLADAAEADEAERLAADLLAQEFLFLPLALLHRGVGGGQVAGQCQYLSHRELGDADAVGTGSVHDDDAAGAGGRDVDVVDPGAGAGDGTQSRRRGDDRRGDLGGAADDDRIGSGDVGGELFGGAAAAGVDVPAFGAEQRQSGLGQIICDYDFHGRS
jgi:hypothetical protein